MIAVVMDGNSVTADVAPRPRRSAYSTAAWTLWAIGLAVVIGAVIWGSVVSARPGGGDYASLAVLLAPAKAAPYFGLVNLAGAIAGILSLVRPGRGALIALGLNAFGILVAMQAFALHLAP